jgi:HSP20 family protein
MSNNILSLVDSFFDDYRPTYGSMRVSYPTSVPALNIKEKQDQYQITLTIPGLDPKDVKVNLNNNVLTINYEHKDEMSEEKDEMLRQEYKHYSFSRSVSLPKGVDSESISAESKDGILTISVNKLPESQPKSIEVKIN